MKLAFAKGNEYAVLGLGKSGRASVDALIASGATVIAWDDNLAARTAAGSTHPALLLAAPEHWKWDGMHALILSPGIVHQHPAVVAARQHRVEIINDIELLYRAQGKARYIAITGTNGKSTTTSLIGHILKSCGRRVEVGGNLGIPALALEPLGADGIYVLELSSYQLEALKDFKANSAVWLNITPDHIDHHGSLAAYIDAKKHIFDHQQAGDIAIVGIDDAASEAVCRERIATKSAPVIPISGRTKCKDGVYVQDGILTHASTGETADLRGIPSLRGEHNGQNAAAAYAACIAQGLTHAQIIHAMESFQGLPHRMQWLGESGGIAFVNDSKATNADAAEKSLRTYENIYWILGGVAKEGGIELLAPYFPRIRHAYLIGEAAESFALTLKGQVAYTRCGTLEKAFHTAVTDATRANGGVVLLAPACASFDQFANFEKRGEAFMALVEKWKVGS